MTRKKAQRLNYNEKLFLRKLRKSELKPTEATCIKVSRLNFSKMT